MTFEQYFALWLAEYLDFDIETLPTPQKIAVILADRDTTKKWITESTIRVDVVFEKKIDAASWSARISEAMESFVREKDISRVRIGTETADRTGLIGKWQYTTMIGVLHRTKSDWNA